MPRASKPKPGPLTVTIARLLSEAFIATNMNQATFGARVGISQSQLSKHLRGEIPLTLDQLDRICHELRLNVVEVIDAADFQTSDRFE